MKVIAEGVETTEQAAAVRAVGCGEGQGYLYGRPAPVDQLTAWLEIAGAAGAGVGERLPD
jgi:EAL domain-containing protein (putative c-di-GMP-specific phosphodiesterase class I)